MLVLVPPRSSVVAPVFFPRLDTVPLLLIRSGRKGQVVGIATMIARLSRLRRAAFQSVQVTRTSCGGRPRRRVCGSPRTPGRCER